MSYTYFVFDINSDKRVVVVKDILYAMGVKSYLISEGERCSSYFSPTYESCVHNSGGDMLTDFINNISRCVIISEKVKTVFEQEGLDDEKVEYLPFILKDKRGRKVPEQYYIANPLVKVDCFDEKNSTYLMDEDDEPEDYGIQVICVEKENIPEDIKFFRLGIQPQYILIRSDLVDRIKQEGFTGLSVKSMNEELS